MENYKVKELVRRELQGLHKRFGYRLFGAEGRDCLNLSYNDCFGRQYNNGQRRRCYDKEWFNNDETPNDGILGLMMTEIEKLKDKVDALEAELGLEYE